MISNQFRQESRDRARSLIFRVLSQNDLSEALRGSWKYDDFHLSSDGLGTRSDLDLVVTDISDSTRLKCIVRVQDDLRESLPLRVSIHRADSLLEMSIEDSYTLNVGEFIAKTRGGASVSSVDYSYLLAKITLLLLRQNTAERYSCVSTRLGTVESIKALNVKLGNINDFSIDSAVALLATSSHPVIRFFEEQCVRNVPSRDVSCYICERVRQCRTIAPWLQGYLIEKITGDIG